MKITVLDKISFTNGDLNLNCFNAFGKVEYYDILPKNEVASVLKNTDIVVCNKTVFDKELIDKCPSLKFIGLTATGYNNVDCAYAKKKGIVVCNVPNYSTCDVAQHVFAFILNYTNKVSEYNETVKQGLWKNSKTFCYFNIPLVELAGKTLGVIGYGNIGKKVSDVARAFGCKVIYSKNTPADDESCVDIDTLCKNSDIITLHCPLNDSTRGLIDSRRLDLMKKSVILVNSARGAVCDESAVAEWVKNGNFGGFGCDVYSAEPFTESHPFYGIKDMPSVCLTPHIAWASFEARTKVVYEMAENIKAFLNGEKRNRVE